MATATVDNQLEKLVERLGKLRTATPVTDPDYPKIVDQYKTASDALAKAIDKAIDDSDTDYVSFSKSASDAIQAINDALSDINKLADSIKKVAELIDIIGKVVVKLVA